MPTVKITKHPFAHTFGGAGFHNNDATMYERNTPPKLDTLQCICEAFNLTLAQFFLEDEQIEVLSEQEKSLLESFRKLPPKKQKALIDLL